jgi:LasA protease
LAYINGPAQVGFNTAEFINQHEGWLKTYLSRASKAAAAPPTIDLVARNFSISPRLLLAMLEYQSQGLSNPAMPDTVYFLGYQQQNYKGLYLQLVWAANTLNNGYYGWRAARCANSKPPIGACNAPTPGKTPPAWPAILLFAPV